MEIEIRHDEERKRFVATVNGAEARLEYRSAGDRRLDYRSTYVPEEHRHRGIGEALVTGALDWAREQGYRVVPSCPFVRRVIDDRPEYQDLLAGEERPEAG